MLWPVVKALLGHYRRYPFQIVLVWLGLTLGVSLLVGVSSINNHVRHSYQHGEKLFSTLLPYRIRAQQEGDKIPPEFYSQLRDNGFEQCTPFERLHITAIKETTLLADPAVKQMIEPSSGILFIACAGMPISQLAKLEAILPQGLVLGRSTRTEFESLTEAFHINLNAMGMLSFFVGLFIFYQAMSLTLTQRQPLVGNLRQMGVSGWQLAQALIIELLGLVLIAWLCGNILGILLANQLIPTVSASLSELYDTQISHSIALDWRAALSSLDLSITGTAIACGWPLVRLLRSQPSRLNTRLSLVRFAGAEFSTQAVIASICFVIAMALYQAPPSQQTGFVILALMLISVALVTPFIIWKMFEVLSYTLPWVKVRWFFADAAASMSYRGVATMAFMLAMAANIGVETMVGNFKQITDNWLTQRLAADLYVSPDNIDAERVNDWLAKQPEVKSVWSRWEKNISTDKGVLQVVSIGSSGAEHSALSVKIGIPNYWYHLQHSNGIMISESMALKLAIRPGDYIDLVGGLGTVRQVVGVYYDYGNPYNQVLVAEQNWLQAFTLSGSVTLGTVLHQGTDSTALKQRLENRFRLYSNWIFDNNHIHNQAMRVFNRTFSIADSLGNITLVIAVFGIFFATVAGEVSRQKHISLLRCLGMSGRELIFMASLQLFVFGAIAILIALPLGIMLADLLVDIVIKPAFGWAFELQFMPLEYLNSGLLVMFSLMFAGATPVLNMVNNTPMKSLREAL